MSGILHFSRFHDRLENIEQLEKCYGIVFFLLTRGNLFLIRMILILTRRFSSIMVCGCRCVSCKSQNLAGFEFKGIDGLDEMHHTCLSCGRHFDHLDGEAYRVCITCNYP